MKAFGTGLPVTGWLTRLALWLVAALALISPPGPASAHRQSRGLPDYDGGIVIPNLSHGQMSVIADNKAAITDLAERQFPTDPVIQRLQGFINIQHFACFWGVIPGSLRDEASPFNECMHAELAAARTLLIHIQAMPGNRAAVQALVSKIQTEMLHNRTALVLCQYSDEPFNTAEVISPHWADIPSHPPTSAALGGVLVIVGGGGWFALRRTARAEPPSRGFEKAEHADANEGGKPQPDFRERGEPQRS